MTSQLRSLADRNGHSPQSINTSPRPRRTSGYTLRSSPLAGPAIANDGSVGLTGKTRTGATPSRISAIQPCPSSESAQCTEYTSEGSTVRATSLPRDRDSRPHSRSRFRTTSAPALPSAEVDYGPFTVAQPTASADLSLADTASPAFSRRHSKGVIMPVKAPKPRRPQTAPATLRTHRDVSHHSRLESVPPPLPPVLLPDQTRGRSIQRRHISSDTIAVNRCASGAETGWTKKRRRRKSLMSMSVPPELGEVREESEDEEMTERGKLPLGLAPSEGLGGEALAKLPGLQGGEFRERGKQDREGKWTTRKWPWRSLLGILLKSRVNKEKPFD